MACDYKLQGDLTVEEYLDLSGIMLGSLSGVLNEKSFPVLEGVSPVHLRILESSCRLFSLVKGVELIREGDEPDGIYFVVEGEFAITKMRKEKRVLIAKIGQGELFGEYGLLRDKTRYAGVIAASDAKVAHVAYSAIRQVVEVNKMLQDRLTQIMNSRIVNTFFHAHPIFSSLAERDRVMLQEMISLRSLKTGQRLINHGERIEAIYLVVSGEIALEAEDSGGDVMLVDIRRDGSFVGDIAFCNKRPNFGTATAICETDLLVLDRAVLEKIKELHPSGYTALMTTIKTLAQQTATRIKGFISGE
ncbi:MAG: cyclic nucleotide-binding domain-containing protein [Mariprofundales bacterium]|nr:cyclic nucleotide-binding domain-containing protein [Mariprofundales bacterium]